MMKAMQVENKLGKDSRTLWPGYHLIRVGGTCGLCNLLSRIPGTPPHPTYTPINGVLLEKVFNFSELLSPHWDKNEIENVH